MGMRRTSTLLRNMEDLSATMAGRTAPYLAYVASISGNIATIYRFDEESVDAYEALMLRGYTFVADDVVVVVDIGRQPIIIGKVHQTDSSTEDIDFPVDLNGQLIINKDSAALLVRQADGTNALYVDTTGASLQLRNALDLVMYRDAAAATQILKLDGQNGALLLGGTAPSISTLSGLGSGGSATIAWGNDLLFHVTVTAGTSGMSSGSIATITFNQARPNTNYGAAFGSHNNASANLNPNIQGRSVNGFNLAVATAPVASTAYTYTVWVGGMG